MALNDTMNDEIYDAGAPESGREAADADYGSWWPGSCCTIYFSFVLLSLGWR
jgi:hypothetical protein